MTPRLILLAPPGEPWINRAPTPQLGSQDNNPATNNTAIRALRAPHRHRRLSTGKHSRRRVPIQTMHIRVRCTPLTDTSSDGLSHLRCPVTPHIRVGHHDHIGAHPVDTVSDSGTLAPLRISACTEGHRPLRATLCPPSAHPPEG